MKLNLLGKKILVIKGSLLSERELEAALQEEGAKVQTVTNLISAFSVIERQTFDGAVIDKGLHNQAFDLCTELQSLDVPYIIASSPHDLQKSSAKIRDAKEATASLIAAMRAGPESRDVDVSDFFEIVDFGGTHACENQDPG
jgi:PleD family two-component response regulator